MKKQYKLLCLVLALMLVFATVLTACKPSPVEEPIDLADVYSRGAYGVDYTSLWDYAVEEGWDFDVFDVVEDPKTGLGSLTIDGKKYELGMDFLSFAMVYSINYDIIGQAGKSAADQYNLWWKYYIVRWNYLMPEVPLYSNAYYDVYNSKIDTHGQNTNPFWAVVNALPWWTSADNKIIIGNTTAVAGKFMYPSFLGTSPSAADVDINDLITGYSTVISKQDGDLHWDESVVVANSSKLNDDGSKTFTIKIKEGLKFSDGSAIKADNYVAGILALSTQVAEQAKNSGLAGESYVGYEEFYVFDGTNAGETAKIDKDEFIASKSFSGVRLLGDYEFSLTIKAEYLPYYFEIQYLGASPAWLPRFLGTSVIKDDGQGCYISGGNYYAQSADKKTFTFAATMAKNVDDISMPTTGAYKISKFDNTIKEVTLVVNDQYQGNFAGVKPGIPTVVYKLVDSAQLINELKTGGLDVVSAISGKSETQAAIALCDTDAATKDKFDYMSYDRAGYGKLAFRSDFSPTAFQEVRQAIAHTLDVIEFRKAYCGDYGTNVYGPYYEGFPAYLASKSDFADLLNEYEYNLTKAKQLIVDGGWVYNSKGQSFNEKKDDVRYKKLEGEYLTKANLEYASIDGAYKTIKLDGEYYMPLVLNWCSSTGNPVADTLSLQWFSQTNIWSTLGAKIYNTPVDFTTLQAELSQRGSAYSGKAVFSIFNLATGWSSAVYDYSYNWSVKPQYWIYSACYLLDSADYVNLK